MWEDELHWGECECFKGGRQFPLRQALLSLIDNAEHIDKQAKLELLIDTATNTHLSNKKQWLGCQAHNNQPQQTQGWWDSIWMVQDTNNAPEGQGDLQLEVEVSGDHSLFT